MSTIKISIPALYDSDNPYDSEHTSLSIITDPNDENDSIDIHIESAQDRKLRFDKATMKTILKSLL